MARWVCEPLIVPEPFVTPFDQTVLAAQVRRLEVAKVATTRTIVGVG